MIIHLLATDVSVFELVDRLPPGNEVGAVVYPANRLGRDKIGHLVDETEKRGLSAFEHTIGTPLPSPPDADIAISWLYSQIIDPADIGRYRLGIMNFHGGRLPEYRGAHVLQWAIINGEREIGATWHGLEAAVDCGPVWAEGSFTIGESEGATEIRTRMIESGAELFTEAWQRIVSGSPPLRWIDADSGRIWPSRTSRDSVITDDMDSRTIRNLVRALQGPWPPATLERDGASIEITAVSDTPTTGSIAFRASDGETIHLIPAEFGRSA